ncbi:MAG: hypothetical protein IIX69_07655 [Clostridia bacterium]|nr:hypothetical protein [Clostridia bacterium]
MRTKKMVMLCLTLSVITGIIGAILRTVTLLAFYSTDSGHFTRGDAGMLPGLAWGVCVLGLLVSALMCLASKDALAAYKEKNGKLYTIGATVAVCAILTVIFESLSAYMDGDPSTRTVNVVILITAVLSAVAVFSNAFMPVKGIDYMRASLSVIPAIFVVMPGFRLYFDSTLVLNSPNKNVYILAACLIAAMIIYECRFHTEMSNTAMYVVACCGAVSFGIFCGVPNLVYSALNGGRSVINSMASDLLITCYAVFAGTQLLSLHRNRRH